MAKNIFKPAEIVALTKQVELDSPFKKVEEPQDISPIEEYMGPTADDLMREAENFKASWALEKQELISRAKAEAENVIKEAEQSAEKRMSLVDEQIKTIKNSAQEEAESILQNANKKAQELLDEAQDKVNKIREEAIEKGKEEGREEGFDEGQAEVERLIEHLRNIISKAIDKRTQIIEQSEKQLVELIVLICQKVVKVISENQKNVVINNVAEALKKLKNRGDVIIRVNLEDAKLTNEHTKDFLERIENIDSITVLEDSSIGRGGCVIETDFGQIDARITSQLKEIEEKILDLAPITSGGNI